METFGIACAAAVTQRGTDPALPLTALPGVPSAARSPRRSRGSADTCREPRSEFPPCLRNTGLPRASPAPPDCRCAGSRLWTGHREMPRGSTRLGQRHRSRSRSDTRRQWISLSAFRRFNKRQVGMTGYFSPSQSLSSCVQISTHRGLCPFLIWKGATGV